MHIQNSSEMGHQFMEKRSSEPKMELLRLLFMVVAEGEVELHSERERGYLQGI